ncbi:MAG: hypothetical protein IJZ42_04250 [Lachnospiraceae bacterium]|nr:hypothetical protein [Lachnospiraceae bacterium]
MKRCRVEIIISVLLMAFICMPLTTMLLRDKQFFAIDENRNLSSFPEESLAEAVVGDGEYFKKIETWFNDRFGFRDMLIRTKNQINFSVFRTTGDDGVYIGDEGYLSYKSVVAKEQIANEKLEDSDLEEIVDSLEHLQERLLSDSIVFMFIIPAQKNDVFPERAVGFPVRRPTPNNYEVLCSKFKENIALEQSFVDVVPILREAEEKYPTYYRTDFHWNSYGATVVYSSIVNSIAQKDGIESPIFDESYYTVEWIEGFQGGQLQNIPLWEEWNETTVITRKIETSKLVEVTTGQEENGAKHWINKDENAPLGTVLLIGDSYTQYMIMADSGVLDCFEEVYWVHTDESSGVIDNYANMVDYVIFEKIESGLPYLEELVNEL